jgi:hypothetical protein
MKQAIFVGLKMFETTNQLILAYVSVLGGLNFFPALYLAAPRALWVYQLPGKFHELTESDLEVQRGSKDNWQESSGIHE